MILKNNFPQLRATTITTVRDNVEDIFPRAVRLFLINYYFKPEYKHLNNVELSKIVQTIRIELTLDDVRFIEEITQDRKKSWYWQKLRAGRVTASKFKSVCEASLADPDVRLLTEICCPEKCVYTSKANQSERIAITSFTSQMKELHSNFNFKRVGLIVDRDYPYFAATPGGLCSCVCCGEYFVEIKCPFGATQKNASLEHLMEMKDSFMEVISGRYRLRHDHEYYYQLQMQMALGKYKFSYLYVWSSRFRITSKILFDSLFWAENSVRALEFAKKVLSIELMNSYYTNTY